MAEKLKQQFFGIVRDKTTGAPKVDKPEDLHPIQLGLMTRAERAQLGVRGGSWARDAQGIKPIDVTPQGDFIAEENLVAVSEIFELGEGAGQTKLRRVFPRCDVAAGSAIPRGSISEPTQEA